MEDEKLKRQKERINGLWVFGILIVLLILSVSMFCVVRIINADVIMTYISFASTLLSITLSIFAIAYTYTSNNQVNRQFEQINHAAKDIIDTSQKLQVTEELLKENLSTILSSIEDVKTKTVTIMNQVSSIGVTNENPPITPDLNKSNLIDPKNNQSA